MAWIRAFFRIVFWGFIALVLLYVLPRHDVARITGTEIIRADLTKYNSWAYSQNDSGNDNTVTRRDLRLINTQRKKAYLFNFIRTDAEETMVYRNEDTGWIWPPYFKFDSSDLQAEANNYTSTSANPQWVIITRYGWRNNFLTIYPNAISIKPTDTPNPTIVPWFNIFFFIFLIAFIVFIRRIWAQFRERTLDPAVDKVNDKYDEVKASAARTKNKYMGSDSDGA